MVKYIILTLLFVGGAVSAQTFPKPPDVADYVPIVPQYESGTTPNGFIDANVTPPPQAGLSGISTSQTGRTTASGAQCISLGETGGSCAEAKFRTEANATGIRYDDPIRGYGLPGQSHCHTFFGNRRANAFSTYSRLRTNNSSYAAGAELNATGYWHPCIKIDNAFGDGKNYAVKPELYTIYYNASAGAAGEADKNARTPNGLRYIWGTDMDDPDRAWLQAIVNTANAQSGTAGRYSMPADSGFVYKCAGATPSDGVKWLKNSDNSDPFGGTCVSGAVLTLETTGPSCWDGVNLWSPGGYRHVIPEITDGFFSSKKVCPKNYYRIPHVSFIMRLEQRGFSDYGRWRLASDDMAGVAAGRAFRNMEGFHTDWMDGWDPATKQSWEDYCVGLLNQVSHECNGSAFSATASLIVGSTAPNGRTPQVAMGLDFPTNVAANMWRLPANSNGPDTLHVHGN